MNEEPKIKVTTLYGYCELRDWFEFDGEKLVGMCNKKTYDRDGKLVEYSESPTGLVVSPPWFA